MSGSKLYPEHPGGKSGTPWWKSGTPWWKSGTAMSKT